MSGPASAPTPAGEKQSSRGLLTMCLMAGTLMQAVDTTVANVSLPYMQGSLSASRGQITWVLTSYVIAAAIMTSPMGWIAGRFGRRNVYVFALAGFTLASIFCGASQTLGQVVLFRILQGAFAAALAPLAQSMMLDLYPGKQRGSAMALYGSGVMLGPILGPTIGGYLTEAWNWRWVFYINVPFGIAAVVGLLSFPTKGIRDRVSRFDWAGFGFLSIALGSLQLMLDRGAGQSWFHSPEIAIEGTLSALCLYLFVVHLLTSDAPFIRLALFKDINFVSSCAGMFLVAQLVFAGMAALPPYFQNLGGYSTLETGLLMTPRGVGTIIAMPLAMALLGRVDVRFMLAGAILLVSASTTTMAYWTPAVGVGLIAVTLFFQGFATGFIFGPMNLSGFATLPAAFRTEASAILNLSRNMGSAIGVSITNSLMAGSVQSARTDMVSHATGFNRALQSGAPGMVWNPATPMGAATLNGVIERQSQIIAYSNNFLYLGEVSLLCLVALILMRKPEAPSGEMEVSAYE